MTSRMGGDGGNLKTGVVVLFLDYGGLQDSRGKKVVMWSATAVRLGNRKQPTALRWGNRENRSNLTVSLML
jgi:hypothetical protein